MPRPGYSISFGIAVLTLCFAGCASYKKNVMFSPAPETPGKRLTTEMVAAESTYTIQPNDQLQLEVLSNNGERLVDPNAALSAPVTPGASTVPTPDPTYVVASDGTVKLPLVGTIALAGKTLREAENLLAAEFSKFYKESYVILNFTNKRVIVLGATTGQVIPLTNENTTLVEVLALAKGIGNDGRADNIRVVRGQDVYVVNLSTLNSAVHSNMKMLPGDIVYVEPIRRPFAEGLRDLAPMLSLLVSIATLVVIFTSNQTN